MKGSQSHDKREDMCFFVSDLHGAIDRYEKLFHAMERDRPAAVFLGGDLLPSYFAPLTAEGRIHPDFINDFMRPGFERVRTTLGGEYPGVFLILGNDDLRSEEEALIEAGTGGVWRYIHGQKAAFNDFSIYGYAFVPPTPFRLKDWEKYDVSEFVDPGCTHPAEGMHSTPISESELKHGTIRQDLENLAGSDDLVRSIFLFHTPPHGTNLDYAALDGKMIDHAPLDVHVGSIAVRKFIESRRPLLTLHGHVHESVRITGSWREKIGRTHCFSAAHDGEELCLVRFSLENLEKATRELV